MHNNKQFLVRLLLLLLPIVLSWISEGSQRFYPCTAAWATKTRYIQNSFHLYRIIEMEVDSTFSHSWKSFTYIRHIMFTSGTCTGLRRACEIAVAHTSEGYLNFKNLKIY